MSPTLRFAFQMLAIATVCAPASSASLHEGALIGQVQQQFNGNEIDACGVTITAIEARVGAPAGTLLVFNGSAMVFDLRGGLVKGRAAEIDAKLVASGKANFANVKVLPTETIWMKAPDVPVTTPRAGTTVRDSDDKGYRIYVSDFAAVWGVIDAIVDRKVIQIGFRTRGSNTDQALFGTVQLSEGQHSQLVGCLREWSAALKKKYKLDDADLQRDEEKR